MYITELNIRDVLVQNRTVLYIPSYVQYILVQSQRCTVRFAHVCTVRRRQLIILFPFPAVFCSLATVIMQGGGWVHRPLRGCVTV